MVEELGPWECIVSSHCKTNARGDCHAAESCEEQIDENQDRHSYSSTLSVGYHIALIVIFSKGLLEYIDSWVCVGIGDDSVIYAGNILASRGVEEAQDVGKACKSISDAGQYDASRC
jgi:hypothetical protein